PRRGGYRIKNHAIPSLQLGKNVRAGETASANASDPTASYRYLPPRQRNMSDLAGLLAGIFQDCGVGFSGTQLCVSLSGIVHLVARLQQRRDVNGAGRKKVEKGLHIAALGPAYVTYGVIAAAFFVA